MEENKVLGNNEAPVAEGNTVVEATPVLENTVVETTPVVENAVAEDTSTLEAVPVEEQIEGSTGITETQGVDGFVSANVDSTPIQENGPQVEFVSADSQVTIEPVAAPVNGTPLKPKKKINKTLIVVLIFVVIFGGVMLLMYKGSNGSGNKNNNKQEEKTDVKVNVGTEWGNKYLAYMLKEKANLKTYEISFIDVNNDEVPEMFLKYIDNSNMESLKILFIAEDGYVYETKYYRDFRIRYIYSLKDKTTDWYLYLTTNKQYGSYTKIDKIINDMAFDADIKATTDSLLIEYGKKYYDTDYQVLFYNIKEKSYEDDFKEFVSRYNSYLEEITKLKNKVEDKYKDYEYKEDEKVQQDTIGISGRIYKLGIYYAYVEANEDEDRPAQTLVLVLNDNGTISVDGILYTYSIDYEESRLVLDSNKKILLLTDGFNYMGNIYRHSSTQSNIQ